MIAYRLENARSVSTTMVAALLAGCLLAATGRSASGAIGNGLRTVALTSTPAVGTSSQFAGFSSPVLNDAGRTAFEAELPQGGPEVEDYWRSRGIWSEGSGSLSLLARGGDIAPGTGQAFERLWAPSINRLGQTVFTGYITGNPIPYYTDHGVFRGDKNGVGLLLRNGSPAPTPDIFIPGMQFTSLSVEPVMNDEGQLALIAGFNNLPTGGYPGMWTGDPTDLKLVAFQYMSNGLTDGEYINGFPFAETAINKYGHLAFTADLDGPSLPLSFYVPSIWRYDGNAPTLVARKGDPAPGTGTDFRDLYSLAFNDAGQIVFEGRVADPVDPRAYGYSGIWYADGLELKNLIPRGEPAPGLPDVRFGSMGAPVLNGRGSIAFLASLEGAGVNEQNDWSLWKTTADGLVMVAREGDYAPGTSIQFSSFFGIHAYNRAGQMAFVDSSGLWANDVDGSLHRIVAAGMQLELSPGDVRIVSAFSFNGNSGLEDGRRVGFNERGQVAFEARFTDGSSGVFVSNLVAIPEPASVTLAGILAMAAVGKRRLRRRCI